MVRRYADENVPLPVVEELRRLGHDVLTILEDGKANRRYPDAAVLQDAMALGRVLVTLNRRHFRRLHAEGAVHTGIVLCTFDPDFEGQTRRIHSRLAEAESVSGQLALVNRPSR